jgi:hypothetical protein
MCEIFCALLGAFLSYFVLKIVLSLNIFHLPHITLIPSKLNYTDRLDRRR